MIARIRDGRTVEQTPSKAERRDRDDTQRLQA